MSHQPNFKKKQNYIVYSSSIYAHPHLKPGPKSLNFIVTMLMNRSQAAPTRGSINSGSEKGALAVSFTSNACAIKQATDSHCLFCLSGNSVLSTVNMIRMKGGKRSPSISSFAVLESGSWIARSCIH